MSKDKDKEFQGVPITSPMPGMIMSITAGTTILSGVAIFSMECMKMHFNVPALAAGTFIAAATVGAFVNAGDIIGSAKPRVKIIGDKYDILQIYAPYGGYEHYMKICKSKIPHMAKKLGFTRIKYDEFSNYEDWNYAGHYEKKL